MFLADFVEVIAQTELQQKIRFKLDSPFFQLYFGGNKNRTISYSEFAQFLHDFHEECAIEGFRRADKEGTGFISVLDFQDIMMSIKSHLLTKEVQQHLIEVRSSLVKSIIFILFLCHYIKMNNEQML